MLYQHPTQPKEKEQPKRLFFFLAGLDGVEPSRRESKSRVLPLDYSPIFSVACGILPYFLGNVKRKTA